MTVLLLLSITVFNFACAYTQLPIFSPDNDTQKTLAEYVMSYGYSFEEHKIATPDGYILSLWRIPKKANETRTKRQPVFFQHGLLDNGFTWLFKEGELNLPMLLEGLKYDVWIGNTRGTLFAKEHLNSLEYNWVNPSSKFWDFSIDQMGALDIPTIINYICETTGYNKIDYIGHSQGTVQFFIQSMISPQYVNSHIRKFVGLGAVFFVHNVPGLFEKIVNYSHIIDLLYYFNFKNLGLVPVLGPVFGFIAKLFPFVVKEIIITITGRTERQNFDLTRLYSLLSREVGGTSTRNMLHWIQLMRNPTNQFLMFDYGKKGNLKHYGKPEPPKYDIKSLKQLSFPLYLFSGTKDALISKKDFDDLLKLLPAKNVMHEYIDDYGHLDYIWADNAHIKVYPQVIKFLAKE